MGVSGSVIVEKKELVKFVFFLRISAFYILHFKEILRIVFCGKIRNKLSW